MKRPLQRIILDSQGVPRFRENRIVRLLLNDGKYDLNALAMMGFSKEEHEQFAMLIGYSVSGFGDLDYVSRKTLKRADKAADKVLQGAREVLDGG